MTSTKEKKCMKEIRGKAIEKIKPLVKDIINSEYLKLSHLNNDETINIISNNFEKTVFNYIINTYGNIDGNNIKAKYTRRLILLLNFLKDHDNTGYLSIEFFNKNMPFKHLEEMSSYQMFPVKWKSNSDNFVKEEIPDNSMFKCSKCKSRKITVVQYQSRSGDEAITSHCTCHNCGKNWRF